MNSHRGHKDQRRDLTDLRKRLGSRFGRVAAILAISLYPFFVWSNTEGRQPSLNLSTTQEHGLLRVARTVLEQTVNESSSTLPAGVLEPSLELQASTGVFVTLVRKGKVRGCYGSLYPEGIDLLSQVREYTAAAATRDFRHLPVHPSELNEIVIIISFIGPLEPISSIHEVDPKTEGLLIRTGNARAVLLPGEARTASWQLQEARRQAGISSREPVELYKIHTVTLYEQ